MGLLWLAVSLSLPIADAEEEYPAEMFRMNPGRESLWDGWPEVDVTEEEVRKLCTGEAKGNIERYIEDDEGRLAGYIITVIDAPPTAVWQIASRCEYWDIQDPNFPKSKGYHTFLPYIRYGNVCRSEDKVTMFAYLELPLLNPRKYVVNRYPNQDGFPWEVSWEREPTMQCMGTPPEEFAKGIEEAVELEENRGCWRIEPIPEKYRKSPDDIERTLLTYYIKSHPGGSIGNWKWLANSAQKRSLPKVAENTGFHAMRWETFLNDHVSKEEIDRYRKLLAAYRAAMKP